MQGMENPYPMQGFGTTFWIVWLVVVVFYIAVMWKVFEKAGKPGWAAIIPIYNYIVMLQIAGKPWWWLFLLIIPLVNIYVIIVVPFGIARNFGRGFGFGLGLLLLGFIFFPILAWGEATYQPQAAAA